MQGDVYIWKGFYDCFVCILLFLTLELGNFYGEIYGHNYMLYACLNIWTLCEDGKKILDVHMSKFNANVIFHLLGIYDKLKIQKFESR